MMAHQWGPPQFYLHKIERECRSCRLLKVVRQGVSRPRYLQEFWRDLDQIICQATPPCDARLELKPRDARLELEVAA